MKLVYLFAMECNHDEAHRYILLAKLLQEKGCQIRVEDPISDASFLFYMNEIPYEVHQKKSGTRVRHVGDLATCESLLKSVAGAIA